MTIATVQPGVADAAASRATGADTSTRLLAAGTVGEVAEVLLHASPADAGACVLWSTHWPRDITSHPAALHDAAAVLEETRAVSHARADGNLPPHLRILHDDGDQMVVVWHCPSGCPELLVPVVKRLGELLTVQRIHEQHPRTAGE